MKVELRQIDTNQLLDSIEVSDLSEVPNPGLWFELDSQSYLILQRSHRYRLCNGRYSLHVVALQVKLQSQPNDSRWWNGHWVIGDPNCRFNARSPLLRCAVIPEGPCERCSHYIMRT